MIERIGRRAAEFVGTTVSRAVRAPAAALGHEPAKSTGRRVAKVVLPVAGTAVAVAGVAAGKLRDGLGGSASPKPAARKRTNNTGKPASKSATRTASKTASKASRASKPKKATRASNGSSNGHQEKSRDELYELAKKADVPGRSQMSKDELEKALEK